MIVISFGLIKFKLVKQTVSNKIVGVAYLEKYGVLGVSPKVSDGIPTVSFTRLHLKPSVTFSVGTSLILLFLPGFVANGRSQVNLLAVVEDAIFIANQHSKTGLFENVHVVVVGVTHSPTT